MQSYGKSGAKHPEGETKIEVRTESGRWRHPEIVKLQPALTQPEMTPPADQVLIPEHRVPLSLLNVLPMQWL